MAFHPYPQLIPPVFNPGGSGPPHALTRASAWPWVDHPASGPGRATRRPHSDSPSLRLPHNGLTSRHATDSQAHSSIGTPPPPTPHEKRGGARALTARRRPVSGTLSLPSRGTFHHSLTVLIRYRSSGSIQAAKWSWQTHTGFHEPRATTGTHPHATNQVPPTGLSPTTARHPRRFSYPASTAPPTTAAAGNRHAPTTPPPQPPPGLARQRFSHHPLSLATTHGISSPTGTEMFHFPA